MIEKNKGIYMINQEKKEKRSLVTAVIVPVRIRALMP